MQTQNSRPLSQDISVCKVKI